MALDQAVTRHLEVISNLNRIEDAFMAAAAKVARRLAAGGTLYTFGIGGSELTPSIWPPNYRRFLYDREPKAAVALPTDSSSITRA